MHTPIRKNNVKYTHLKNVIYSKQEVFKEAIFSKGYIYF